MTRNFTFDPERSACAASRIQIGDVAERTGLSLRTIRYYEDVALLPPAERSTGGFRLYNEAAIGRLLVIKQMKPLDFTLEQMAEVLTARDELDQGNLTPTRQAELDATVAHYHQLVLDRIDALKEQVRSAIAFAADLGQTTPE